MKRISTIFRAALLAGTAWASPALWAQGSISYVDWADSFNLMNEARNINADPDEDELPNGVEYALATDPTVWDNASDLQLKPDFSNPNFMEFEFRFSNTAENIDFILERSNERLGGWYQPRVNLDPPVDSGMGYSTQTGTVDTSDGESHFFRLRLNLFNIDGGGGVDDPMVFTLEFGETLGGEGPDAVIWEGFDPLTPHLRTQPPDVAYDDPTQDDPDPNEPPQNPNHTKYPGVAGASRLAITKPEQGSRVRDPASWRSWGGWFALGDAVPPPGVPDGYPGRYEAPGDAVLAEWDYFTFKSPVNFQAGDPNPPDPQWRPVRLEQQPLYLNPWRVSLNWGTSMFGWATKPMEPFRINATNFWSDKPIVRGVNLTLPYPYLYQKGDLVASNPDPWKQEPLFQRNRPLETLVVVPSNVAPDEILQEDLWNRRSTPNANGFDGGQFDIQVGDHQPFPYPVFDRQASPEEQTPYSLLIDRFGDFDMEFVWEGTNARYDSDYLDNRYEYTDFEQEGAGNYMKMTVAQGSPFIWCETNNARYVNFYNLIRVNGKGNADNYDWAKVTGFSEPGQPTFETVENATDAKFIEGGTVPGAPQIKYVLAYGNQINPNQPYQEALGINSDLLTGRSGGWNATGTLANHTYIAIFYKEDTVKPQSLEESTGTDAQGNRYYYLEWEEGEQKNWFVVGSIPVMRYYDLQNYPEDSEQDRLAAAHAWAQELGKYAFNFSIDTQINYRVENMHTVSTEFSHLLKNPFIETGAPGADQTVAAADKTVINLMPHHYQPITLGPDLTDANQALVVWRPLRDEPAAFPSVDISLANANTNPNSGKQFWGYWTPKGNLKSIVASRFTTAYPFQNFLPVLPMPNFEADPYPISGISQVRVTPPASGNDAYFEPVAMDDFYEATLTPLTDTDDSFEPAELRVLIEPNTDAVKQINVLKKGRGYPRTASEIEVTIDDPIIQSGGAEVSRRATARVQVGGNGEILAVFMVDKGAGYRSTIRVEPPAGADPGSIDEPLILPTFDTENIDEVDGKQVYRGLAGGLINSISAGYGYDLTGDNPPTATLYGTGSGAAVSIIKPGEVSEVINSNLPPFVALGLYPGTGDPVADAAEVDVLFPAPPPELNEPEATAPKGRAVMASQGLAFRNVLITNPGSGLTDASNVEVGHFVNQAGAEVKVIGNIVNGAMSSITVDPEAPNEQIALNAPADVVFEPAYTGVEAKVMVQMTVTGVELTEPTTARYDGEVETLFTGGFAGRDNFEMPELDLEINPDGTISLRGPDGPMKGIKDGNNGSGFNRIGYFIIQGGRGFNAALTPILNDQGGIAAVKVMRTGSNYPANDPDNMDPSQDNVRVLLSEKSPTRPASLQAVIEDGRITDVRVLDPGEGYNDPNIELRAKGNDSTLFGDPKGTFQFIIFEPDDPQNFGGVKNLRVITPGENPMFAGDGYIPGAEDGSSAESLPVRVTIHNNEWQVIPPDDARGFLGTSLPADAPIEKTLYDSTTALFANYAAPNQAPFGAGFLHGSPDGYGLGNTFSSVAKTVGLIFNLYQHNVVDNGRETPEGAPSRFLINRVKGDVESPVYRTNSPLISLRSGLKTSVQGLQRALTLLFQDPPYRNAETNPQDWNMSYFSQYQPDSNRVVINPSGSIPFVGIASSTFDPPALSNGENQAKIDTGDPLRVWEEGKLFSGFGVSDQWTDQHYFYGYYLSTAGIAAVLEGAWLDDATLAANGRPDHLWSDAEFMGQAIDQWLMTYAFDSEARFEFYRYPEMTYQHFAFFDRWSGHPWASGTQEPAAGASIEPPVDSAGYNPFADWRSWGTGNEIFGNINENSTWEGLQSLSAAILWGAGTNRREIVELGMYLLATGNTASDLYFLDKNYNLKDSDQNEFSWIPTTSSQFQPLGPDDPYDPTGGNSWPVGTGYTASNPAGFFGEASAGASILRQFGPTTDTFFWSYPAGPKFIESFPPTPWTLGMTRNLGYMQDWAGVFVGVDSNDPAQDNPWGIARDSGLFQPAIWNAMAMTSAMVGIHQLPGDTEDAAPYVDRAWSSWASNTGVSGANVTTFPNETATNIMTYLHVFEEYGSPDWTLYAKVVTMAGAPSEDVLFTAAFSKIDPENPTQVITTLVAFNPGWTKAYVNFCPIDQDGALTDAAINQQPIEVKPKRMALEQVVRPIQ